MVLGELRYYNNSCTLHNLRIAILQFLIKHEYIAHIHDDDVRSANDCFHDAFSTIQRGRILEESTSLLFYTISWIVSWITIIVLFVATRTRLKINNNDRDSNVIHTKRISLRIRYVTRAFFCANYRQIIVGRNTTNLCLNVHNARGNCARWVKGNDSSWRPR